MEGTTELKLSHSAGLTALLAAGLLTVTTATATAAPDPAWDPTTVEGEAIGVVKATFSGGQIDSFEGASVIGEPSAGKCINLAATNGGIVGSVEALAGAFNAGANNTQRLMVLYADALCATPVQVLPRGQEAVVPTKRWVSYRLQDTAPALKLPSIAVQQSQTRSTAIVEFNTDFTGAPNTDVNHRTVSLNKPVVNKCIDIVKANGGYPATDVLTSTKGTGTIHVYTDSNCQTLAPTMGTVTPSWSLNSSSRSVYNNQQLESANNIIKAFRITLP